MKRSDIHPLPEYFDRYINLAPDVDIVNALEKTATVFSAEELEKVRALGASVYAPGKWSMKDIIRHLIDTERIMAYRALRFARKDSTLLPGFEENEYAVTAEANSSNLDDLLEEFVQVRKSNIYLFKSFTDEMQQQKGVCFKREISVLGLGFVLAGHPIHHVNVIRERYFPLLQNA